MILPFMQKLCGQGFRKKKASQHAQQAPPPAQSAHMNGNGNGNGNGRGMADRKISRAQGRAPSLLQRPMRDSLGLNLTKTGVCRPIKQSEVRKKRSFRLVQQSPARMARVVQRPVPPTPAPPPPPAPAPQLIHLQISCIQKKDYEKHLMDTYRRNRRNFNLVRFNSQGTGVRPSLCKEQYRKQQIYSEKFAEAAFLPKALTTQRLRYDPALKRFNDKTQFFKNPALRDYVSEFPSQTMDLAYKPNSVWYSGVPSPPGLLGELHFAPPKTEEADLRRIPVGDKMYFDPLTRRYRVGSNHSLQMPIEERPKPKPLPAPTPTPTNNPTHSLHFENGGPGKPEKAMRSLKRKREEVPSQEYFLDMPKQKKAKLEKPAPTPAAAFARPVRAQIRRHAYQDDIQAAYDLCRGRQTAKAHDFLQKFAYQNNQRQLQTPQICRPSRYCAQPTKQQRREAFRRQQSDVQPRDAEISERRRSMGLSPVVVIYSNTHYHENSVLDLSSTA